MPRGTEVGLHKHGGSKELEAVFRAALAIAAGAIANSEDTPLIHPKPPEALTEVLFAPLSDPQAPRASADAEVAFTLCGIGICRGAVPDLRNRVRGDRAGSEALSRVLAQYNIPSTKGALQSSTYRGGYEAAQARSAALSAFVRWTQADGRSLADLRGLFARLALGFAGAARGFPERPALMVENFTFARTRRVIEALRTQGSGGAYEQYLVAAFLAQEYEANGLRWRVTTKAVGASDATSRAPGDIQVTRGSRVVLALEVSANAWRTKVTQALSTLRSTALSQATVLADATGLTGESLEAEAGGPGQADLAVVSLDSFLDVVSSRLSPPERARAMESVFGYLVRWERDRADLAWNLVRILNGLGLASASELAGELSATPGLAAERLRRAVRGLADDDVAEVRVADLRVILAGSGDDPPST
jgi:hypothetical protein